MDCSLPRQSTKHSTSLLPRGFLPWSLNKNKCFQSCVCYFFSHYGNWNVSSTPKQPFIYYLYIYFPIEFAPQIDIVRMFPLASFAIYLDFGQSQKLSWDLHLS